MNILTRLQIFLLSAFCGILSCQNTSAQTYVRYVKPEDFGTKTLYADSVLTSVRMPRGVGRLSNYPQINAAAYELSRVLQDPDKELMQVWVCGSTSPDGLWKDNVELCNMRTEAAAAYIRDVTGIPEHMIHKESLNEDWDRLAELVTASDLPYKYEVLYIIRAKKWGERKTALQKLDGGKVWDILERDFFPQLRCVRFAIFCKWDPSKPYLSAPREEVINYKSGRDTIYVRDTVYVLRETIISEIPSRPEVQVKISADTVAPAPVVEAETLPVVTRERVYEQYREKSIREIRTWDTPWMMGFKTNLISDAMLVPSLGVEIQLARKLSLDIQGWLTDHNVFVPSDKDASAYGFSPELRWWLSDDLMKRGFFLGLHGTCMWYTLQWKDGLLYQNGPENVWNGIYHDAGNSTPAWSAGVTGGYSLGLGRKANWGLEFVVGVGYGNYKQNVAEKVQDSWRLVEHQNKPHFGITRAGINLTYRFSVRKVNEAIQH